MARSSWFLVGLLLVAGCSVVRVEPGGGPTVAGALRLSLPGDGGLSARTAQELYRRDLLALFPDSMDDLAARLHADALLEPAPELLFALSEVHYQLGRRAEKNQDPRAPLCYFRAAGYAYHFLFGYPQQAKRPIAAFDPRFRVACDLYNTALARCLVLAQAHGQLDARGQWFLPAAVEGEEAARLEVAHAGFFCQPTEFGSLMACAGFRPVGLACQHRTYGLGVPFIGERAVEAPPRPFVPPDLNFPVTAFCRFEGGLEDLLHKPRARLEFINPLTASTVRVRGQEVPLETDLTTPLAHYLGQAHLERAAYRSFLEPGSLGLRGGLHFLAPYQPGKVPVVLVHGLLSSPAAWATLLNDLMADPLVRQHFCFGVYFYPTGEPYLTTAADLRRDLTRYRQKLDPGHADRALDEMVLIGHSMGGLIGRLLTVDGGEDFWRLISPAPLPKLRVPPEDREELVRTCYFKRQGYVKRVIFMGTPHHGSKLSPSLMGRLAARFAGVPAQLLKATHDLSQLNPELREHGCQLPTSVDLLDPQAPALTLIAHRPRPAEVRFHSVIGVSLNNKLVVEHLFGGDGQAGDGVVPYESAHLDEAESELVVQADHYHVQQHPLALREVRRILLEHLDAIERRQVPK